MIELTRRRVGDRADVHDLREPMGFLVDRSIDVVLSSLAIPYVQDLGPVFFEFRRVLRRDGCLVLSTHHPFSDWAVVRSPRLLLHGCRGGSLERGCGASLLATDDGRAAGFLFQAGFLLDGDLEPTPPDDVLSQFPDEDVSRTPNFVFLRAIPDPAAAEH